MAEIVKFGQTPSDLRFASFRFGLVGLELLGQLKKNNRLEN